MNEAEATSAIGNGPEQRPNVLLFDHPIPFLSAFIEFKRKGSSRWSMGGWSKRLGLANTSVLTNIIKGRKPLTHELAVQMVPSFGFNQDETNYFLQLIDIQRSQISNITKTRIEERLHSERAQRNIKSVDLLRFEVISEPKYFVLRELIQLKGFKEDPKWIQSRSRIPLSLLEINSCIENLIKAGLFIRNHDGVLCASDEENFDIAPNIASQAIKHFHSLSLKQAKNDLFDLPVTERHFGSVVIGLKKESIPQIKERIEIFRKELLAVYGAAQGDEIFQLNLQFIPLTQTAGDSE